MGYASDGSVSGGTNSAFGSLSPQTWNGTGAKAWKLFTTASTLEFGILPSLNTSWTTMTIANSANVVLASYNRVNRVSEGIIAAYYTWRFNTGGFSFSNGSVYHIQIV
jgi:hypothetical protein